jgi:hypothetical protein
LVAQIERDFDTDDPKLAAAGGSVTPGIYTLARLVVLPVCSLWQYSALPS